MTVQRRPYLEASADISDDGRYRYWLSRRLSMGERSVLFVGLNPSTANATIDDPTIRRCVGFARAWGYDWLYMGNLNAWRSKSPRGLPRDPLEAVGDRNKEALAWLVARADLIIAAWGSHTLNDYARKLGEWVVDNPRTQCLGQNDDASPKHPLYLPKSLQPVMMS